jgi:Leucine-rich repeat (LRR) protein
MKFNPFSENKIPSVSMFSKERKKQVRATTEFVEDLEEKFGTKEYLGVKMDPETLAFFKQLVSQIGEGDVRSIIENFPTQFDDAGRLRELFCNNQPIISLPKLPSGLKKITCLYTQIASLPELPPGLTELYCDHAKIALLPTLPDGLTVLHCSDNPITSLPELPTGLKMLILIGTPISKDQDFMDKLIKDHPSVEITY